MKPRFLTLLALLAALRVHSAVDFDRLDEIFAAFSAPGSPGASVGVIEAGEILASRGYGLAQLEYGVPITPETIFHVASVSKQFTSFAVVLLADEGKLNLDDEVQQHLPWVNQFEYPVTIRHLMNHTSGIRDQWELLALAGWRLDDVISSDDVRLVMEKQVDLNFPPGSEYMYSNMGYTLLADIVEAVSGTTFVDFCAGRIFEPLGMTNTHFHDDHQHVVPNRAYSYFRDDETWKNSVLSYANAGATSLFTTAADLLRWLDNFRTRKVGSSDAHAEMIKVPAIGESEAQEYGYASGISVGDYRGLTAWSHSGGDAGFRSFAIWFPQAELGISVAANAASANAGALATEVADLILGDRLAPPEAPDNPAVETSVVELSTKTLSRYAHRLRFDDGLGIEVMLGEGHLVDSFGNTWLPISETSFLITAFNVTVSFVVEGDAVVGVSYRQGGNEVQGQVVRPEPLGVDARALVGAYLSPELDRLVRIDIEDETLVLRHPRHGDLAFVKEGGENVFRGTAFYASTLRFEYDDGVAPTALFIGGGRNRNHRFNRVDL